METDLNTHVQLGRTGLTVSRIGIASGYGASVGVIEKAFHDYRINYFYWSTPRSRDMKHALKNLAKTNRDEIVIVLQSYDHSGLLTERAVNKGLRALGIEYADILLLGWYNYFPKRIVEKAFKIREKGKIKHIALSGHNRKLFGKLAADPESPIDVFMCRYNAVHRGAENDIFPQLDPDPEKRPGITTYTTTCWRKLLDPKKMPPGEVPVPAADCYRFALSHPDVNVAISGPATMDQLDQNMLALEQGALSTEEMSRIKKIGDYIYKK